MVGEPDRGLDTAPGQATPDARQGAMRCNASMRVMYFAVPLAGSGAGGEFGKAFFEEAGAPGSAPPVTSGEFVAAWKELSPEAHGATEVVRDLPPAHCDVERAKGKLGGTGKVAILTTRPGPDGGVTQMVYAASRGPSGIPLLFELTFKAGFPAVRVVAKTSAGAAVAKMALAGVVGLLRA